MTYFLSLWVFPLLLVCLLLVYYNSLLSLRLTALNTRLFFGLASSSHIANAKYSKRNSIAVAIGGTVVASLLSSLFLYASGLALALGSFVLTVSLLFTDSFKSSKYLTKVACGNSCHSLSNACLL